MTDDEISDLRDQHCLASLEILRCHMELRWPGVVYSLDEQELIATCKEIHKARRNRIEAIQTAHSSQLPEDDSHD